MRLLLIQPTLTWLLPEGNERRALFDQLGLAYLAAWTRENGHEVTILDCVAEDLRTRPVGGGYGRVGMTDEAIAVRMRDINPEVVGITCQFTGFDADGRRLAALAKKALPGVPVLVGGADATARAEDFAQDPHVDAVIRGEGELTLLEILDRYGREGKLPTDVPGTTLARAENPAAEEVEDVDDLPLPARDLLPMEVYLHDQRPVMPYAKRRPIGFMISSRGCPYNCIFCSTTKVWRRWRPHSPVRVVDEIEHLVQRHGVREIAFQDDSFLVDPERVRRICEEILRRNIDISWSVPPGVQANRLTDELLRTMKASGFYRVCFPIESGDPDVLQWMRKPVDLDEVEEAIALCHALGIWTYGNFIIGFPEQTEESIERTAQYAENCGLDMISVYVAQPYAGSDLYDLFEGMGLLDPEKAAASTVFHSLYNTKYFTAADLRAKRDEIYGRFMKKRIGHLFSPSGLRVLWHKINTAESFAYAVRIAAIMARNTLKEGRVNLLGSMGGKQETAAQEERAE
jgi:radical SAM superfamily enzyme YgiQ (UPF0313 family)